MTKGKANVERRLSNKEIDEHLGQVKFTKENEAKQFYHLTEQNWFRQYGKGSSAALKKITAKVKKGIKQNKYGGSGQDTLDTGWKKFMKQKPVTKKQKKIVKEKKKVTKDQTVIITKASRKEREQVKKKERKAPSGREYSNTEIHEGVGSKRAVAYRKGHKIKKNDWSYYK